MLVWKGSHGLWWKRLIGAGMEKITKFRDGKGHRVTDKKGLQLLDGIGKEWRGLQGAEMERIPNCWDGKGLQLSLLGWQGKG